MTRVGVGTTSNISPNTDILSALKNLQNVLSKSPIINPQNTRQPAPSDSSQKSSFLYFTETIAAGGVSVKFFSGNFFFLQSNNNSNNLINFQVSFDDQALNVCPPGFVFGTPFQKVTFKNNDVGTATIVYFVGNGNVDYKALVVSSSAPLSVYFSQATAGTYTALNTTVGTTALQVFTSGTSCKRIYIQADLGNSAGIYLGFDNSVTNTKYVRCLLPGDYWEIEAYDGNLWAYSLVPQSLAVSYA